MVALRIEGFAGMAPLISRRLLATNMAETAFNTNLRNGELRSIRQPRKIKEYPISPLYGWAVRVPDPAAPLTPVWIPFTSKYADFFPNPLTNDAYDRYVWVDNNGPGLAAYPVQNSFLRIKTAQPTIQLGVPAPTGAPTVTVTGGSNITVTRSYVYTYVNIFDEEGAPSDPVTVTGHLNGTWTVTGFINPVNAATRGLNRIRLYRTISGSIGTQFFRVTEFAISTTTYVDSLADSAVAQIGVVLGSTTWAEPLQMEGLALMPNGFFAGWKGRNLYFSEPYRPWAWPAEYTLSVDHPIVDCGVIGQTLIVLTTVAPVFVTGVTPSAMSMAKLTQAEPCLSANSVAASPEGLYFASTNGLMLVTPQGLISVTRNIIGREIWQRDYAPYIEDSVIYDGQYLATGNAGNGFLFGALGDQPYIAKLVNLPTVTSTWTDPYTSEAHLMLGNDVYEWDSPHTEFAVSEWTSKEFQYQKPINLGAFSVSLDSAYEIQTGQYVPTSVPAFDTLPTGGPWPELTSLIGYNQINGAAINAVPAFGSYPPGNTAPVQAWPYWYGIVQDVPELTLPNDAECEITVLANGVVVWQGYVEDGVAYRLPSGYKAERWQFKIKTRVPVYNLQVAETSKELAVV